MYDYDSFLFFVFPFFFFFFFANFGRNSNPIPSSTSWFHILSITLLLTFLCYANKNSSIKMVLYIYTISLLVRRLKMSFLFFFRIYYLSIAVVKMWPLTQDCSLFASFANYRRNSNPIPTSCSCCHFLPITVLLTFLCYATKTPQSGIFR